MRSEPLRLRHEGLFETSVLGVACSELLVHCVSREGDTFVCQGDGTGVDAINLYLVPFFVFVQGNLFVAQPSEQRGESGAGIHEFSGGLVGPG